MDIPNLRRLVALEIGSLHLLGITQAEAEEARDFMHSYALDFDVAIDPVGEVKELYRCGSVPQKVLID
ncbi:MAG: TlpA family protein disulfide reductase, partial [bacterium]